MTILINLLTMDNKQIINGIANSYLFDPTSQKNEPILIIDLKSSVCSFKYEIYSDKGFYLNSSYQKKIQFGNISNNDNRLIIQLKKDDLESYYFIRLYEVNIAKISFPQLSYESNVTNSIELYEPIFYFYQIKSNKNLKSATETANVQLQMDDDDDSPVINKLTNPPIESHK